MNKNEELFVQLIYIFQSSAMLGMGKLKNPGTDKIERNLEQAEQSIDMLEMIRDKTKGNISVEMQRTLNTILTDLRLNFVDEKNKDMVGS